MKALIWIGCIFSLSVCTVIIKNCGIILGGILTALMFGAMWWAATTLCKKWDERKSKSDAEKTGDAAGDDER